MSVRFLELGAGDVETMEAELRTLCARSGAEAVVLLDLSGAVLASHRTPGNIDEMLFAALLSSNFAATEELSHRLGVTDFKVMFHEGKRQNLYFMKVTDDAILVVLFSDPNALGRVKLFCEKSVPEMVRMIGAITKTGSKVHLPEQARKAAEYLAQVARSMQAAGSP